MRCSRGVCSPPVVPNDGLLLVVPGGRVKRPAGGKVVLQSNYKALQIAKSKGGKVVPSRAQVIVPAAVADAARGLSGARAASYDGAVQLVHPARDVLPECQEAGCC